MDKYWIIGSSSGIGKELAKKLDSKGYSLILSSRNEEKLKELNTSLINDHEIAPLDLSEKSECFNVAKKNYYKGYKFFKYNIYVSSL